MHHSSFWPREGVDYVGKRVCMVGSVGTGSTEIQMSQEMSKQAAELTIFERALNMALLLPNQKLAADKQAARKEDYPGIYRARLESTGGYDFRAGAIGTIDHTPGQREANYSPFLK
ncbi:uncharacterized protein GLRG_06231 [Colletotrichum graminicola M1.001]|uniref:Uncharacterized protein n=1 Tax=Colletotrichum graminicola (strain M1.001 / M2 / FGSC 10212) TaxID=645133 RepID=E3QJP9_COLGM|nr:uncharacterized protein GLRG_06231 [Colletotrichum graminicola M1.001]EFQ31087.1 hypothetical protein GLRG_06231 [Colletotrichum graminicola M1.001]